MAFALPEGVGDLAPSVAEQQYSTEKLLLEVFRRHGYRLLRTPVLERLETLQAGLKDHHLPQVFHLVDPETGVPLVLRPDLTLQVARYLAQQEPTEGPTRIAVSGPLYRVERGNDLAPRERHQAGVELVGWSGVDPDIEILKLALHCLDSVFRDDGPVPVFAVGDAHVLEALLEACSLSDASIRERVRLDLRRKAFDDVLLTVERNGGDTDLARRLTNLTGTLKNALLWHTESWPAVVQSALEEFTERLNALADYDGKTRIIVDLTEVRDRSYYTGVVFEAFISGTGRPILKGGRYDRLLPRFGVEKSASGFAVDLDAVIQVGMSHTMKDVLNVSGAGTDVGKILDLLRRKGYDAARWPGPPASAPQPRVEVGDSKLRWSLDGGVQTTEGTGNLETLLKTLATWSEPR